MKSRRGRPSKAQGVDAAASLGSFTVKTGRTGLHVDGPRLPHDARPRSSRLFTVSSFDRGVPQEASGATVVDQRPAADSVSSIELAAVTATASASVDSSSLESSSLVSVEGSVSEAAPLWPAEGTIPGTWTALVPDAGELALSDTQLADAIVLPPFNTPQSSLRGLTPNAAGIVEIPIPGASPTAMAEPASPSVSFPVVLVDLESGVAVAADLEAMSPLPSFARSDASTASSPAETPRSAPGTPAFPDTEDLPALDSSWTMGRENRSLSPSVQELEDLLHSPSMLPLDGTIGAQALPGEIRGFSGSALPLEDSPRPALENSDEGALPFMAAPGAAPAKSLDSSFVKQDQGVTKEVGLLRWVGEEWERSGTGPRVKSILGFAGPALGIWLCSPLMSLIDTAVVGSGSSVELAALGPGTIVSDNLAFLFMFLSTAAGNLIATSMAEQNPEEASNHLRRLLLVAMVCGAGMVLFSEFCSRSLICGLAGPNSSIVPAACRYARIRGLAWPAVLVASVTQSASLALQDSWTPLLCLSLASAVNLVGDLVLCRVFNMGIAGAALATTVSQYAGCLLMVATIAKDKRLRLGVSIPSTKELFHFMSLAGPIFLSLVAKVGFYTLVTYMATSLGTVSLATHQVVIGIFAVCAVCAEPLSQTAQAFLPRLCVGAERNLKEARALIQTLGAVALLLGVFEALAAAVVATSMPGVFTSDPSIAQMMAALVVPVSVSLLLNPLVLAAEGVLLAARDVRFLALAMLTNVAACGGLLVAAGHYKLGLLANWWIVVLFQIARIAQACRRITSPHGIVRQAELHAD